MICPSAELFVYADLGFWEQFVRATYQINSLAIHLIDALTQFLDASVSLIQVSLMMNVFLQAINKITAAMDGIIPSEIPVPKPITIAAEIIGEKFASPSFPYRLENVDLTNVTLWQAAIVIFLQPFIWNCLGRLEYKTRALSTIFFKPLYGVYALALWIFVAGLYRDALFVLAMDSQQTSDGFAIVEMQLLGGVCLLFGAVLVLSSFYRLGVTGTFLGDYFGFLLDERVTAFPFNLVPDPMYHGSTLAFLGKAILERSPTGVFLAGWVYVVYRIACIFEGSFTALIYAQKEREKKKQ